MERLSKQIVMSSTLLAMVAGIVSCLSLPGEICGDGWCSEGYHCTAVDLVSICVNDACGNGNLEAGEECDDGNLNDDDDCLQSCKLASCGDHQINLRTEECDDGNITNDDGCDSNCTVTACGNGVVTAGEMCDDGNRDGNDGCDGKCAVDLLAYIKASNTNISDAFGNSIALSADGSTLAVGAPLESSAASGINGDQADNSALGAGAVYVFTRNGTRWNQQAYIKATNTDAADLFGSSVALSTDGSTLAVGALGESSLATGVGGDQTDNSARKAGAVYVFARSGTRWSQQTYLKASNTGANDEFGYRVVLSADGVTLAVSARYEASAATGIGGNQTDNSADGAGAVYVFRRNDTTWIQQAYVKASNTGAGDEFSSSVALSADGSTLAVGAMMEGSAATGIDGSQTDNSADGAGAVYVFTHNGTTWSQQAYVKASNTGEGDGFGTSVALSADGSTLAVGAIYEKSAATGIDRNQADNTANKSGAVYVFTRSDATWRQQAYVKSSNTDAYDGFGSSVAVSADGLSLVVGASFEDSAATGIDGNQADNSTSGAGAVYLFKRSGVTWTQQVYAKASNAGVSDYFGAKVALSADGATLAIGAYGEASAATGIGGNQADDSASMAGAVYVFLGPLGL